MLKIGKREFNLHTSKYLKEVENTGEELIITHQNVPALKLIPFKQKHSKDLAGLITQCEITGDINDPVFPGFDKW